MPLDAKDKARKRITQREAILESLSIAGQHGRTSEELNKIAFRYSAIIFNLRHMDGYLIDTFPRTGTECARFVLRGVQPSSAQLEMFY